MDSMENRREAICALVNERKNVTFAEIKEAFPQVSDMTIRTDLRVLDEKKRIVRIHGGAKSVETLLANDDLLGTRSVRNVDEKQLIAQKAVKLIRPNMTIFIDSGSTTTALASAMEDMELMVFTNSITVAMELAQLAQVMTYLVGGRLNRYSMSTTGGRAIDEVRKLTFDQVFLGTTGYQRSEGFSCGSDDEAVFKQTLVQRSHKRIVLMDSSKENRPSTFRFCGLNDVRTVVSDGGMSSDFAQACENSGVTLL